MRNLPISAALVLAFAISPALAADYVQAPGSSLAFAGKYQGEVFTGSFPAFTSTLSFDPADLASARLDVVIPLMGATTGNTDYDAQMLGDGFLAITKFPQARYTATTFRNLGNQQYAAVGMLSLHGFQKPVTLTFTWTPGASPLLVGSATVRRLDFGVGAGDWADTSLIPDDIAVSTRLRLTPATP
ncbi:MAG: YceI family protein [Luteimonas sp.]